MDGGDGALLILLAGPVSATGLYWFLYRHYRNTDKSHAFERETAVDADTVTGTDEQVSVVKGTRASRISGDNVSDYRARVKRDRDAVAPDT